MAQSSADLALSSGVPIPSVPASSLGGGGIDSLLSQMQSERGAMQAQSEKTQELLKKPIGKLDDIGEEDKKLKPPELTTLPQAPPAVHSDPLQTFGSPASWLAVFGGLLTRNHLTNSLNAAAGVFNARNQGDAAQTKYNMDLWKANTDNAIKVHEFEMDKYKESIEKLGTERQDALAEIQAISASTKNDTMYMLAANKDAEGVLKYFESLNSQMGKMQKSLDNTNLIEQGVDLFKQSNPTATPKELYDERVRLTRDVNSAEKGSASPDAANSTSLTEEGVDLAAKSYLMTGTMPPLGMGKSAAGTRSSIINKAAEMAKDQGSSLEDIISGRASYKADSSSLSNLTKMTDSATSFENTALKNMDVAESLAPKGEGSEVGPIFNRWLQAGRVATGDPDVAAFNASMNTVANEYAKIMSGSTGSMAATEGARSEAQQMVSSINSPDQIKSVFDLMRKDMNNRTQSLREQRETIQGRLKTDTGGSDKEKKAPSVGDVEDGHKFKGGDPANPDSWERVQ